LQIAQGKSRNYEYWKKKMNYVLEVGSKKMVLEKKGKDRNKGFL